MTFDRFMKNLLLEEGAAFPNTAYRNDCWYSFTPQGLMHRIFILRRRTGQFAIEYGTWPLIAPLQVVPGNSVKKEIFGRPSKTAWSDFDLRTATAQEPESVEALRRLLSETVLPDLRALPTIRALYDEAAAFSDRLSESPRELYGADTRPYLHPYQYLPHGTAAYVFAYLHKAPEGLDGIQKTRELDTMAVRGDLAAWKARGCSDEALHSHEKLNAAMQLDETGRRLLLLPQSEQEQKLREIFDENRIKIKNLLNIAPKFDLERIFAER